MAKRYFVITESVEDQTPRILIEADEGVLKVWNRGTQKWEDGTWAHAYVYGDDRSETVEITPESVKSAKASKDLIIPAPH